MTKALRKCFCGRVFRFAGDYHECKCGLMHAVAGSLPAGASAGKAGARRRRRADGHAMIPCDHRGGDTGEVYKCGGCVGEAKIYECEVHGTCLLRLVRQGKEKWEGGVCIRCDDRSPKED